MNITEAALFLGISDSDLKSISDLGLINHNNYTYDISDLERYKSKRVSNDKMRYIPLCDIEMLKNDKWEG